MTNPYTWVDHGLRIETSLQRLLGRIYEKLHVGSRTEATVKYLGDDAPKAP